MVRPDFTSKSSFFRPVFPEEGECKIGRSVSEIISQRDTILEIPGSRRDGRERVAWASSPCIAGRAMNPGAGKIASGSSSRAVALGAMRFCGFYSVKGKGMGWKPMLHGGNGRRSVAGRWHLFPGQCGKEALDGIRNDDQIARLLGIDHQYLIALLFSRLQENPVLIAGHCERNDVEG